MKSVLESLLDTVLKLQDFSVNQILREINFGESRNGKIVILVILGALNCVDLVNFSLQKVEKTVKIRIQSFSI